VDLGIWDLGFWDLVWLGLGVAKPTGQHSTIEGRAGQG